MDLPYGKYDISLLKGKTVVYKSSIDHTSDIDHANSSTFSVFSDDDSLNIQSLLLQKLLP